MKVAHIPQYSTSTYSISHRIRTRNRLWDRHCVQIGIPINPVIVECTCPGQLNVSVFISTVVWVPTRVVPDRPRQPCRCTRPVPRWCTRIGPWVSGKRRSPRAAVRDGQGGRKRQFHTQKIYWRQFHTHLTQRQNHTHTVPRSSTHTISVRTVLVCTSTYSVLYVLLRTPYCMYYYVFHTGCTCTYSTVLVHVLAIHTVVHIVPEARSLRSLRSLVFAVFAVFAVFVRERFKRPPPAVT